MSSSERAALSFNGINATTGEPLLPPLTAGQLGRRVLGEQGSAEELEDLRRFREYLEEDHLDTRFRIDCRKLEEAGWGVIFPHGSSEEIRQALAPLLHHRRSQASRLVEGRYRELTYRPGESKPRFLARHGVGPGPCDPDKLPYYLLIVGNPEEVSFRFQYQLDVQYAVGRLSFAAAEEYSRYAEGVVAAESGGASRPRRATFFGVANPDDRATQRSLHQLVEPLADRLSRGEPSWDVERIFATAATKAELAALLGGERTPALLFTASHGLGFPPDDPRQLSHQGSLLCQDWPGPEAWRGPIPARHYLAAEDLPDAAGPAGLVAFHFACYGAGAPRHDSFADNGGERRPIAPQSFVARLPQRLLGHPRGTALAVVGHVDQAWSYSFDWPRAGEQLQVFESTLDRLMDGYPVGAAMEYFNQRHAELATDLSHQVEESRYGASPDYLSLSALWTANNDARSYVVLGDPAVRLAVAAPAGAD